MAAAVAGPWRTPANVARDDARNPVETLAFFGVTPRQCVLEIYPGGGWYSEILVPLLKDDGHYIAAVNNPATASNERAQAFYSEQNVALRAKFAANPEVYGEPEIRELDIANPVFGEPGTVDTVVTFRNVHNWLMAGTAEAMFKGFFDVLKPGGVLGVVEHRAAADVQPGDRSGYVGQAQTIAMAEAAGFVLEEASEINANPADTKDHEAGVWSLPPSYRLGDKDREKYQAIGESDRMTLRFRKPN
ncbi:MAG TPA: methyltransferase [Xanthomonadales bacterium]|nr:methyltransferase [Xanthomonadales bacterium]